MSLHAPHLKTEGCIAQEGITTPRGAQLLARLVRKVHGALSKDELICHLIGLYGDTFMDSWTAYTVADVCGQPRRRQFQFLSF